MPVAKVVDRRGPAAVHAVPSTPRGVNRCQPGFVIDRRQPGLDHGFHHRRPRDTELRGDLGDRVTVPADPQAGLFPGLLCQR